MARRTDSTDTQGGGRRRLRAAALGLAVLGATALVRRRDERARTERPERLPAGAGAGPGRPITQQPVPAADRTVVAEPRTAPPPAEPELDAALPPAPVPVAEEATLVSEDPHALFLRDVQGLIGAADPAPSTDATDQETSPEGAGDRQPGRRKGKRQRARAAKAQAGEVEPIADPVPDAPESWEPRASRGRRRRKAEDVEALPVVATPRLPRRRTSDAVRRRLRIGLVVVLLGACAAVPWAVPAVRDRIAEVVPKSAISPPPVKDPAVAPAQGFIGPLGVAQSAGPYAGRRLASAGRPLEVRVPRLGVDSPVMPISGQSGELIPPSDPQQLGWWQEGPVTGARLGSAVVTGHTVHTGGGAFDHLGELVPGDVIKVRTHAGWIRYVVQGSRVYSVAALARDAAEIFRRTGPARLVLITCSDFNGTVYLSNAVVYAVPVREAPFGGPPADIPTQVPDGGPTAAAPAGSGNTEGGAGVGNVEARARTSA